MSMKNFQIASDMSLYFGGDDYDSVKKRVIQMGKFELYISDRIHEWFLIPEMTSVWVDIDHLGRIDINGKYRFDNNDLSRMNHMLLSIIEAAGRNCGMSTYGSIHFFEDTVGWEIRQ